MRRIAAPVLSIACIVAILIAGVACGSTRAAAVVCPPGHTSDYLRAVRSFPSVHRLPSNGKPAFAPKGLWLSLPGGLQAGGGRSTFYLGSNRSPRYRLGWNLRFDTQLLSRSGKERALLSTSRIRLNRPRSFASDPLSLSSYLPARPAFYRLDVSIRDARGRAIAAFSEYVRVVPVRVGAKLALGSSVYRPGEAVGTRIENTGTSWLTFGRELRLEERTAEGWARAIGPPMYWPQMAFEIPGGAVGGCEQLPLSSSLPAGTYPLRRKPAPRARS